MPDCVQTLIDAAKRLVESVEYDVNGTAGKGGNGGLTSDKTLRLSSEVRIILDRIKRHG